MNNTIEMKGKTEFMEHSGIAWITGLGSLSDVIKDGLSMMGGTGSCIAKCIDGGSGDWGTIQ